jgi:hypothetical protein
MNAEQLAKILEGQQVHFNKRMAAERERTDVLLAEQKAHFEALLAAERTRVDNTFSEQFRAMKAAFGLLSDELERTQEHVGNLGGFLNKYMPTVTSKARLSPAQWHQEIQKCFTL